LKLPGSSKLTTGFDAECRVTRELLDGVGDKWGVLVVLSLSRGSQRFRQLKRQLDGISQRMLTPVPLVHDHPHLPNEFHRYRHRH
jgi:hypothetical protein